MWFEVVAVVCKVCLISISTVCLCQYFSWSVRMKLCFFPYREPRGFAFVQFVDSYDASEAQYHMDRQIFAGREISVVVAAETRKRPEEMRHRTGRPRYFFCFICFVCPYATDYGPDFSYTLSHLNVICHKKSLYLYILAWFCILQRTRELWGAKVFLPWYYYFLKIVITSRSLYWAHLILSIAVLKHVFCDRHEICSSCTCNAYIVLQLHLNFCSSAVNLTIGW